MYGIPSSMQTHTLAKPLAEDSGVLTSVPRQPSLDLLQKPSVPIQI